MPSRSLAAAVERAQAATVRLRVHDGHGHGAGTGTIIDTHGEEALVLTCGHLFRDTEGKGRIEVDVFAGGQPHTVAGRLVDYDAGDRDIALVSIKPGVDVQPVEVIRSGASVRTGQAAFSFGCDRGADPSRRDTRIIGVNTINPHLGLSNLEISGAPIDGRSGGGLFDESGTLIGVCNAADYQGDSGIYTGPGNIHWQLDRIALQSLYQDAPAPEASGASEARLASAPASAQPPASFARAGRDEPSSLDEPAGRDGEVIVIVRNGDRPSEVLTMRDVDADLMRRLRSRAR